MKPTTLAVVALAALVSFPSFAADPSETAAQAKRAADLVVVNAVLDDLFAGQPKTFSAGRSGVVSSQDRRAARAKRTVDTVVVADLLKDLFGRQGPDSIFKVRGLSAGVNEGLESLQAMNASAPDELLSRVIRAQQHEATTCSAQTQVWVTQR